MVDFQFEPEGADPISKLRRSMHEMDGVYTSHRYRVLKST